MGLCVGLCVGLSVGLCVGVDVLVLQEAMMRVWLLSHSQISVPSTSAMPSS